MRISDWSSDVCSSDLRAMTDATSAARWRAAILAAVLIAGGGGYWLGQRGDSHAPGGTPADSRKILYYYDPMFPNQQFDKPGKSPFMAIDRKNVVYGKRV